MKFFLHQILFLLIASLLSGCLFSFKKRGDSDALRGDATDLPARLSFIKSGSTRISAGSCVEVIVKLYNAEGEPTSPKKPLNVAVVAIQSQTGNEGSNSFYTRNGCSALNRTPKNGGRSIITFGAGVRELPIYVRHTKSGNIKLRAYVPDVQSGDLPLTVDSAGFNANLISGPTTAGVASCSVMTITRADRYGNPDPAPVNLDISVSASSGQLFRINDTNCASPTTAPVRISRNSATGQFRFSSVVAGESDLSAAGGPIFAVSTTPGLAISLRMSGPTQLPENICGRYTISMHDAENSNLTTRSSATVVTPTGGTFYSEPTCTNTLATLQIPAGQSSGTVFYKGGSSAATLSGTASGLNSIPASVGSTSVGSLLTAFGTGGKAKNAFGSSSAVAGAAVVSAGKTIVVGTEKTGSGYDFAVARFNSNGTVDTTFGGGTGRKTINVGANLDAAHGVAVDASGNILIVGSTVVSGNRDFAVVRLLSNGDPDTSFGTSNNGIVKTDIGGRDNAAHGVGVQPNGQIVVVGVARRQISGGEVDDVALARYNDDGSLSRKGSFNLNSARSNAEGDDGAYSVHVISDTTFYIGGYGKVGRYLNMAFAQVASGSEFDTSAYTVSSTSNRRLVDFNRNHHDVANAVLRVGSSIYLGGSSRNGSQSSFAIARLNSTGLVQSREETSFGEDVNSSIQSLVAQEDGKILGIGFKGEKDFGNAFAVARYLANGTIDSSFGTNGTVAVHFGGNSDEAFGGAVIGSGATRQLLIGGAASRSSTNAERDLAATKLDVAN